MTTHASMSENRNAAKAIQEVFAGLDVRVIDHRSGDTALVPGAGRATRCLTG